jgi:toxin CcdB
MARFDVYEYDNKRVPLVIEVQADLLEGLITTVVIPLVEEQSCSEETLPRLKPIISINNNNFILMTTDISAVPRNTLGKYISNLEEHHGDEITEALDFLFQGF